MIKNKKGFETYIIGILIVAGIMSFLLVTVVNKIYEPDPPECRDVSYFVMDICQKNKGIQIQIANEQDGFVKMMVNKEKKEEYNIQAGAITTIVLFSEDFNKIELMPYISKGGKNYTCKAKKYTKYADTLLNC